MESIVNHWLVVLLVPVVISVLNGLSDHWDGKEGVRKWIGIAIDVLSFLTPRNAVGTLKLPGKTSE